MYGSVLDTRRILYLLHVSAIHVAVFRGMHHKEYTHINNTEGNGTKAQI
jgi:hypothetical protein